MSSRRRSDDALLRIDAAAAAISARANREILALCNIVARVRDELAAQLTKVYDQGTWDLGMGNDGGAFDDIPPAADIPLISLADSVYSLSRERQT